MWHLISFNLINTVLSGLTHAPELLAEVLVEEAVYDGVGAGRGHAEDVADGVDAAEDLLRHGVGQRARVPQRVQDVERQPANAEDGADPEREGERKEDWFLGALLKF